MIELRFANRFCLLISKMEGLLTNFVILRLFMSRSRGYLFDSYQVGIFRQMLTEIDVATGNYHVSHCCQSGIEAWPCD